MCFRNQRSGGSADSGEILAIELNTVVLLNPVIIFPMENKANLISSGFTAC